MIASKCRVNATAKTNGRKTLRVAPPRALKLIRPSTTKRKRVSMSRTSLHEQIANALVDNAVNDGFQISINSGEKTIVNRSRNSAEIIKAMFHADMDTLTLNVEEQRLPTSFQMACGRKYAPHPPYDRRSHATFCASVAYAVSASWKSVPERPRVNPCWQQRANSSVRFGTKFLISHTPIVIRVTGPTSSEHLENSYRDGSLAS